MPAAAVRPPVRSGSAAGARPEGEGEVPPSVTVGGRSRQVQGDAADGAHDMDADLERPVAQPGHLGAGAGGVRGSQPSSGMST